MLSQLKTALSFLGNEVLKNISVKNGQLTAQNDTCGIVLNVESGINFVCDGRILYNLLSVREGAEIHLAKRLRIKKDNYKAYIDVIPDDNYPGITTPGDTLKVQSDILQVLGTMTQYTDTKNANPLFRGVTIGDQYLYACDRHLLVRRDVKCDLSGIIIPAKSIKLLTKIKASIDAISLKNGWLYFTFEGGFAFTKLIDAKPPNYTKMIKPPMVNNLTDEVKKAVFSLKNAVVFDRKITLGNTLKIQGVEIKGFDLPERHLNYDLLVKTLAIADTVDLSSNPVRFKGDVFVGILAVMNQ